MSSETVATIIGYVLFAISEILPLINIKTNGFLHSFVIGLTSAFKSENKEVQLIQSLVTKHPEIAHTLNILNGNKQIQTIVNKLIEDPFKANNVTVLQEDPEIESLVSTLQLNKHIKTTFTKIITDPELYTSITTLIQSPELLKNLLILQHNQKIHSAVTSMYNDSKLADIVNKLSTDKNLLFQVSTTVNQSFV